MHTALLRSIQPVIAALALILSAAQAQECTPAPPDLVGWWPAEGNAEDVLGAHPGTLSGGAQIVPGKVGDAFSFDGTTGFVSTTLDVQPGAMPSTTWEGWVYPTLLSGRRQIFCCDDGNYDRAVLLEGTKFGVFTGNGVWEVAEALPNQWTHIAVVFNSDDVEFYTNGVRFSRGSAPSIGVSGNRFNIGRNPGFGEYFAGLVDEASVYARALTEAEIAAIYSAETAGKCRTSGGTANVAVTISGPQEEVYRLDRVTNTLSVANSGPDAASLVVLRATLSPLLDFVSADRSYVADGRLLTFQMPELAPGELSTVQVVMQPNSVGLATNFISAGSAETDPNPANDTAQWVGTIGNNRIDAVNGNWGRQNVVLANTPEAGLMLRTGDIDNLNFGWPAEFDPFSGNSTPGHGFPWAVDTNDAPGTDRIFVGNAYNGSPPRGQDGYTGSTSRPANLPQAIVLSNSFGGLAVSSAVLQLFVDDFQASVWGASYQVLLNGVRAPFIEEPINQLVQTGPIGRLITVQFPPAYLSLLSTGKVELLIDDPVSGAGDGYAVDFAKLLLNPRSLAQTGTIQGRVLDTLLNQPVPVALLSAAGGFAQTFTDAQGNYLLTNVPAGQVFVSASKFGFVTQTKSINLVSGETQTIDFQLEVVPKLRVERVLNDTAVLRWPAPISNWILEKADSLSGTVPGTWLVLTVDRTFVDGETEAIVPAAASVAFYRLRKP